VCVCVRVRVCVCVCVCVCECAFVWRFRVACVGLPHPRPAGVFTMGEVDSGDISVNAPFQGPLDATLNYPLYWALRHAFQEGQGMSVLSDTLLQEADAFADVSVLGSFVDNHDNPRFLHTGRMAQLRNALAFILFTPGIPIIYYGTEQGLHGGDDPGNREDLWRTAYNTSAPLFLFLQQLTGFRRTLPSSFYTAPAVEQLVDYQVHSFCRNGLLVITTNAGSATKSLQRILPDVPYSSGVVLRDVLTGVRFTVQQDGQLGITLVDGEPLVLYPLGGDRDVMATL